MLLVCLIWGMNFSVTKSAFDQLAPLPFTAIRFTISSLLLWVIIRLTEGATRLPRPALIRLVVLGLVGNSFYQLAFMLGLARNHRHQQRADPLHRAHRRRGDGRGARPGADHPPDVVGDRPGDARSGAGHRHARASASIARPWSAIC